MRNSINQPSQRQLRVGEQIKEVIAQAFLRGDFRNPALFESAGITVSEVRITPDLKHATAYVLSLGGQNMDIILPALNEEAFAFQKEINRQTQLKFTPKLHFRKDEVFEKATKLESIISSIKYSDQE